MTEERLREIFEDEGIDTKFPKDQDNALAGLNLIAKYLPNKGIEAAGHDMIYSVDPDELAESGITEEDVIQLRTWNWMIDSDTDSIACFV